MSTPNTNSVYAKWSIDQNALLKAFPGATSVDFGLTSGYAFINYDGEAPTTSPLTAPVDITFTVEPRTSQPRPTAAERYADHTKVVCQPDVSKAAIPEGTQMVSITDEINPNGTGRIYKKFEYPTKHLQTMQFRSHLGAEILSDCVLNGSEFKTISITVLAKPGRITTFIRLLCKKTGEIGDIVLRRITNEDGTESFSRRCFNFLVNPEDANKNPEDLVDVQFISIDSIIVDPATGLWTDINVAVDETKVPLSAFRLGNRRGNSRRNGRFPSRRFGGRVATRGAGRFRSNRGRRAPSNRAPRATQ